MNFLGLREQPFVEAGHVGRHPRRKVAPPAVGPVAPPEGGDGFTAGTRGNEIVFTVESDVLFKPGSDVLSDKAKTTLSKIIGILNDKYKGYDVRVEGHTDDQPIKRSMVLPPDS